MSGIQVHPPTIVSEHFSDPISRMCIRGLNTALLEEGLVQTKQFWLVNNNKTLKSILKMRKFKLNLIYNNNF